MISQDSLNVMIEKQFRWDINFRDKTVREMMDINRLIEVGEVAPDFVAENKKAAAGQSITA